MTWQLANAKNRFSEVVNRALTGEPQVVSRRGDAVVVIAKREYEKLTGKRRTFKQFLTGTGPSLEDLNLERDKSPMRNVKL
jgi:antitoxin Phd